jgi:hypothetical protein
VEGAFFVVVEPAEEQRRVGDVLERFGAAIQIRLEVFEGDRVPGHRVDGEDVLAHQAEEFS